MSIADTVRVLPQRTMRSVLISLSHRQSLARMAVRSPLTRPVVARFVAGETLEEALPAIAALKVAGLRTTVDVLGESVSSPELASAAADRYVATLPALASRGLDANVSVKLTQMGLEIDRELCRANVMRILDAARAVDGFVRFDMEDHTQTDATLAIWQEAHESVPADRRRDPGGVAPELRRRRADPRRRRPGSAVQGRLRRAAQRRLRQEVDSGRQLREADGAAAQVRLIPCPGHP